MSITFDLIVVTRIDVPSTVSVTVLDAETAYPPAEASTTNRAPTTRRNTGDSV
jgi:hypothetical protein